MLEKRNKRPLIGVDLMGSDTLPEALASALVQLAEENFPADFLVFVSPEVIGELPSTLNSVVCAETIEMIDDPITAVRRKKESSLCVGLRYLHDKTIDAFISAGNTGALLLAAKTTLQTLPGIDRPALVTLLPTHKNELAVLDVGANLSLKSHHILQFAAMGIAYQKSRGQGRVRQSRRPFIRGQRLLRFGRDDGENTLNYLLITHPIADMKLTPSGKCDPRPAAHVGRDVESAA